MKDTIAFSTLRPDEQQYILTAWNRVDTCHRLARGIDVVSVYLHDDVTGLEAGVFGRAAWPHALDRRTLHVIRQIKLLAHIWREIGHGETKLPSMTSCAIRVIIVSHLAIAAVLTNRQIDTLRMAVTKNAELHLCSGRHIRDRHLESASVGYLLSIELIDHVAIFQPRPTRRRIRCNLRDDRSRCLIQVEEVCICRRDIVHADAQVAVVNASGLDDLICGRFGDLFRDGESRTGKRTAVRDDECVDANKIAVRIDERATRIARIDCRIGLDVAAELPWIVRIWILAIHRADNATRDGELEVAEGIS